jgi:hypothetical protein
MNQLSFFEECHKLVDEFKNGYDNKNGAKKAQQRLNFSENKKLSLCYFEGYTDYNAAKQVAVHWLLEARKFINSQYKHTKLSYLCNEHVTPR